MGLAAYDAQNYALARRWLKLAATPNSERVPIYMPPVGGQTALSLYHIVIVGTFLEKWFSVYILLRLPNLRRRLLEEFVKGRAVIGKLGKISRT